MATTAKDDILEKLEALQTQALQVRHASSIGGVDESSIRQMMGRLAEQIHAISDSVYALPDIQPSENPWRDAVMDACVINHIGWDEADARQSLAALVAWETKTALDPAVSGEAQALIDRGRAQGLGEGLQAMARYEWIDRHADIGVVFADRVTITLPVADSIDAGFDALSELVDAGLASEQRVAELSGVAADHLFGRLPYVPGLLDATSPSHLWLQIDTSEDNDQRHEAFPVDRDGVSWCAESVGGLEVVYVRADLAHRHMRPMASAPLDRTPILLKVKPASDLPDRAERYAGLWFVGCYHGDLMQWGFAAPVGCGGFPTDWFEGWVPQPDASLAGEVA